MSTARHSAGGDASDRELQTDSVEAGGCVMVVASDARAEFASATWGRNAVVAWAAVAGCSVAGGPHGIGQDVRASAGVLAASRSMAAMPNAGPSPRSMNAHCQPTRSRANGINQIVVTVSA